ncbi:MAG: FHA domain-containing protein [Acidobacteriota bacterium]
MSKLLVVDDGKRERELVLVERLVVGRDPACDISHEDVLLSRRHAEFTAASGQVRVRDLGSRNGIFVNGMSAAEQALQPGDVVQIGPLRVRYAADQAPDMLRPEDLDSEATIVLPFTDDQDGPATVIDSASAIGSEDVTRVSRVSEFPSAFVPSPSPARAAPQAPPLRAVQAAAPVADKVSPPISDGRYVFGHLVALVTVVFLSAALPLIVWRGDILGAAGDRGIVAFLSWPVLPILTSVIATYWVGSLLLVRASRTAGAAPTAGQRSA